MSKKPNNVITIVHTGFGDYGKTKVGGHTVSKTHPVVKFMGLLDECQSLTTSEFVQDYLFILGALANNPDNEKYRDELNRKYDIIKETIPIIIEDLPPLEGFIRTTIDNQLLMQLRAKIRQAEIAYCEYITEIVGYTGFNMCKHINILSDYIFASIWYDASTYNTLKVWKGL